MQSLDVVIVQEHTSVLYAYFQKYDSLTKVLAGWS